MSLIKRIMLFLKRRIKYNLHPRAIIWKYRQKHCPDKPVITRLGRDLKVRVYPHDVIGKDIYISGVFEPDSYDFVEKFLKKGMTVFDLGANLGQYTLLAANIVGRTGQVHSFEPNSRIFKELEYNVSLNNLSDICTLNKVAVSDVVGTAKLSKYEPGYEVFSSLGSHTRIKDAVVGYEEVSTIRLDDYMKNKGISRVDFIKIDVEGAELPALRGAQSLLSGNDAPVILLELADANTLGFGYRALETWNYLKSFAYRIYSPGKIGPGLEIIDTPEEFSVSQEMVALKSEWNIQ